MLEIPSKEFTPEELDFLEAMSRLQKNPLFKQLTESIVAERERYIANLARDWALTGNEHADPVNQRVIDYKRGFWNGAIYAVTQFPNRKAKDWERFVATSKESDAA